MLNLRREARGSCAIRSLSAPIAYPQPGKERCDVVITQLEHLGRNAIGDAIGQRRELVARQAAPGVHRKRASGGHAIPDTQLAELAPTINRHERMLRGGDDAMT